MAARKEEDEEYWNASDTKTKAKCFNFEEDEFGSQLCGVSKSGTARLSQQVRAGMDTDNTDFSTDSLSGSFSGATISDSPQVSAMPLLSLISEESLRLILDAGQPGKRHAKGPLSLDEEVRILRRKIENRWVAPPVEDTVTSIMLGHPYSLELYRSLESKTLLLDAAIGLGDGNAILAVVLFLVKTLKKSLVYELLRTRPEAVTQYSHYLTTRLMMSELTDLLMMLGNNREAAMKQFQVATQGTQNPQRKLQRLQSCLLNHFSDPNMRDRQFVEGYIKLLEWQLKVAGNDPQIAKQLVDQPVLASLAHCCRNHWGEPKGNLASPLTLSAAQGVTNYQYEWTVLNVRASAAAWEDIENLFITKRWLGGTKVKGVVPLERSVVQLHSHKAPPSVLAKYLDLIDNLDKRLALAHKLQCHKVIIEVFVAQRDRQALIGYKANLRPQSEDYFYAENVLRASTMKWKN